MLGARVCSTIKILNEMPPTAVNDWRLLGRANLMEREMLWTFGCNASLQHKSVMVCASELCAPTIQRTPRLVQKPLPRIPRFHGLLEVMHTITGSSDTSCTTSCLSTLQSSTGISR